MNVSVIKKLLSILLIIVIICSANSSALVINNTSLSKESLQTNNSKILNNDNFFDFYIKILMRIGKIPSMSACIIKDNSVQWSKGYGYRDIENQKLANENTIYMLASTSKTITATALMQLYEKGEFNLDDDIKQFLDFDFRNPNYPEKKITFEMLLSHTSSFKKMRFPESITMTKNSSVSPYEWMKELVAPNGRYYDSHLCWNDYQPGEQYQYSNINYLLLAYILENITKQTFNEYCKENIFLPLEMYNTSYHLKDLNIKNIANPYILSENFGEKYSKLQHYNTYIFPASDLRTSVSDLSHLLIAHMNDGKYKDKRILKEETINLMHTSHTPNKTGTQYCLGWMIWELPNKEIYSGHIGAIWGYFTSIKVRDSDDVGFIYFMNRYPDDYVSAFAQLLIENALFRKGDLL
jgi:CubicO group peptidase (beta-lactamase class C family)